MKSTKVFVDILRDEYSVDEFKEFLCGWFMWKNSRKQLLPSDFYQIKHRNLQEWVAWSFFDESLDSTENHQKINEIISQFSVQVAPGYNPDISAIVLNYNKVEFYAKPLVFYVFLYLMEKINQFILFLMGFSKTRFQIPGSNNELVCYTRICNNSKVPLVFYHGISPGLFVYVNFVRELVFSNLKKSIILIEQPHVSMKFKNSNTVLHMSNHVDAVRQLLTSLNFKSADFCGHSLGSVFCTWLVNHDPSLVNSIVLVDPVCFKLYDPTLSFSFVYRRPELANEFLTHWFLSREVYISHYISRYFVWHQSVLFAKNCPKNTHVIVAENDNLINSRMICKYLSDNSICYTVLPDTDHGEFIINSRKQKQVIKIINL